MGYNFTDGLLGEAIEARYSLAGRSRTLSILILPSSLCCSLPPFLHPSTPLYFHFSKPPQAKYLYTINFISSLFLHHDVAVPYYTSTAMRPRKHGLKPLKHEPRYIFHLLNLLTQVFCQSHRKTLKLAVDFMIILWK